MPENAIAILERQFEPLAPRLAQALSGAMPVERLIRTVMISVERSPKLLECDRQSLFMSAMSAACLGLEVDGVTGQAYLIPFAGKAQLVIGYRGMNTLAARAGITITGAVVREGDLFEYEFGDKAFVRHIPSLDNTKARIIAAWATATSPGRTPIVSVLGIEELLAVKARSPGAKKNDSPWNDPTIGFPAMCEKTAKRRLARSMPLNTMQIAARMDEAVEEQGRAAWVTPEHGVVVDIEPQRSPTPSAAELTGRTASATANGGAPASSPSGEADVIDEPPADPLLTRARERASDGEVSWNAWFSKLTPKQATQLQPHLSELQQRVAAAGP